MKITLPIIHVQNKSYFIGVKLCTLELKGAFIYVDGNTRFPDFIKSNCEIFKKQLCFYMLKSGYTLERVVQSIIDGKKIENVSEKDVKIFLSYAMESPPMSPKSKKGVKFVLTPNKKNIMINYGSDDENDKKSLL